MTSSLKIGCHACRLPLARMRAENHLFFKKKKARNSARTDTVERLGRADGSVRRPHLLPDGSITHPPPRAYSASAPPTLDLFLISRTKKKPNQQTCGLCFLGGVCFCFVLFWAFRGRKMARFCRSAAVTRLVIRFRFVSFLFFAFRFFLLLLSCSISLPSFIHSASIEAAAVRDTDRTVQ